VVRAALVAAIALVAACGADGDGRAVVRFAGSALGAEGEVLARQVARFEAAHPGVDVEVIAVPDSADQRHQLYVQWLNAASPSPDVLQLDVIWTAELAAAGWLAPLADPGDRFFAQATEANRIDGRTYAVPLFIDVGVLYYRTDLVPHAPRTWDELVAMAKAGMARGTRYGLVLQGARYEGLITGFLELVTGQGGSIVDGDRVGVDGAPAVRALGLLRAALRTDHIVPDAALGWQEEQARHAFQRGDAVFMRNWPYAYPLMMDPAESAVVGRFAVAPVPGTEEGRGAAALGGAQLALNARSRHPDAARALIDFLTAPDQQLERARIAGQYPALPALYASGALDGVLPIPAADALRVLERAVPRPVTPVYAELSAALQVHVHRALSEQVEPAAALAAAAGEMRAILAAAGQPPAPAGTGQRVLLAALALALAGGLGALAWRGWAPIDAAPADERHGWLLIAPAALVVAGLALAPLAWTVWESLHALDLRAPQHGRPFVGVAHYQALAGDARFWSALGHTVGFAVVSVALELVLGLALALVLHGARRGRGAVRAVALLPWAIPTVVAALIWRFMFSDGGVVDAALIQAGMPGGGAGWLVDATLAWVPVIAADVWKTTPFVALVLLAGLQGIDPALYDAARTDGASRWQTLWHVTLPLLRPALLVVLVFRTLDAIRVFDLVYGLTGGGPGTATEPISLLAHATLLGELRFGRGAALSVVVFAIALGLAIAYARLLRDEEAA
jgi:ABC-type sugar transport system permease subunit/ABC-type glycerol-3-phosphate transport system substrate-binding protein